MTETAYSLITNTRSKMTHLDSGRRAAWRGGFMAVSGCGPYVEFWEAGPSSTPPTCKRCAKKVSDS